MPAGLVARALAAAGLGLLLAACQGEPPQVEQPRGQVARGQKLLAQYQCGSCHAIPGVPASRGAVGAPLEAFGRRSYIAGRIPNRPEALARWIANPQSLVPGTPMPGMGASAEDARDMAAYLHSLR